MVRDLPYLLNLINDETFDFLKNKIGRSRRHQSSVSFLETRSNISRRTHSLQDPGIKEIMRNFWCFSLSIGRNRKEKSRFHVPCYGHFELYVILFLLIKFYEKNVKVSFFRINPIRCTLLVLGKEILMCYNL